MVEREEEERGGWMGGSSESGVGSPELELMNVVLEAKGVAALPGDLSSTSSEFPCSIDGVENGLVSGGRRTQVRP